MLNRLKKGLIAGTLGVLTSIASPLYSQTSPTRTWQVSPPVVREDARTPFYVSVRPGESVSRIEYRDINSPFEVVGQTTPRTENDDPLVFHDDGLNGDNVANDGIFTAGPLRHVYNSCAEQGYGEVIDNHQAQITGSIWLGTDTKGYYGQDYGTFAAGSGKSATWNFSPVNKDGVYELSANYTAWNTRSSNVEYDITSPDGTNSVVVDQKTGGQWKVLDRIPLYANTSLSVKVNQSSDGSVCVDAVSLGYRNNLPLEIIVDNLQAQTTGNLWLGTDTKGYYGQNYGTFPAGKGERSATFNIPLQGRWNYNVEACWSAWKTRASNAPIRVRSLDFYDNPVDYCVRVNQKTNGGVWNYIGTFVFDERGANIGISNDADGTVCVDAIRITRDDGPYFLHDPNSPFGISEQYIGNLVITKPDGSEDSFLVLPSIEILDATLPASQRTNVTPKIIRSNNLVNIVDSSWATQSMLRGLSPNIKSITNSLYTNAIADNTDFFVLFSPGEKMEKIQRREKNNFTCGMYEHISVQHSGTSLTKFNNAALYGSASGKLRGIVYLDSDRRGINSATLGHELTHAFLHFDDADFGAPSWPHEAMAINPLSNIETLIGGFAWKIGNDGMYYLDPTEGRNGGTRAAPLVQYAFGLIPAASVPDVKISSGAIHPLQRNGAPIEDIVKTIPMSEIVSKYGIRMPTPDSSQKRFNITFVVPSSKPLDEASFTMFDTLAKHSFSQVNYPVYVGISNWAPLTKYFGDNITFDTTVSPK